jgi:hypothetical protein
MFLEEKEWKGLYWIGRAGDWQLLTQWRTVEFHKTLLIS